MWRDYDAADYYCYCKYLFIDLNDFAVNCSWVAGDVENSAMWRMAT